MAPPNYRLYDWLAAPGTPGTAGTPDTARQITALQSQLFDDSTGYQGPIDKRILELVPPPKGSGTWTQDDWINYAQSYEGRDWFTKRAAASRQLQSSPSTDTTKPPGGGVVDVDVPSTTDPESLLIKQALATLQPSSEVVLPMGNKWIILSKDYMGRPKKIELPRTQTPGQGQIDPLPGGIGWKITDPDGKIRLEFAPRSAGGGGGAAAQFDWAKDEAGVRYTTEQAALADERANETKRKIAQIEADTALTTAQKAIEKQKVIEQAAKEINDATIAFNKWKTQLETQGEELDRQAQLSIAQGNWQVARDQLASAEKIAAAKAQVDREIAAMTAYGNLLSVESQERSRKAESAAAVFKTLADLAPRDQLRSAFYLLRGQAPPPSTVTQIPPGLMAALGVNPDTAAAAAQQLRGATTVPPWLSRLMGGQ